MADSVVAWRAYAPYAVSQSDDYYEYDSSSLNMISSHGFKTVGFVDGKPMREYTVGGKFEAVCKRNFGYLSLPPRETHNSMRTWARNCMCGFYSRKSLDSLLEYIFCNIFPLANGMVLVLGPVLLSGWITEGELGYRSEHMTVLQPEYVIVANSAYRKTASVNDPDVTVPVPIGFTDLNHPDYYKWGSTHVEKYTEWRAAS